MDERERRILGQNREYLAQELVPWGTDVIYELREEGVLSHDVARALLESETTMTHRMRSLLSQLEECGGGAFGKLTEALVKLGLGYVAKTLDGRALDGRTLDGRTLDGRTLDGRALDGRTLDGRTLDGRTLDGRTLDGRARGGEGDEPDDPQRTPCLLGSPVPLPTLPRPPGARPGAGRKAPDGRGAEEEEDDNSDEGLAVRVKQYREVGGFHLPQELVYRNLSMPRGLVFMANYKDFLNEQHSSREGSEIDVKNLTLLFTQMGYAIPKQHVNLNKYETIKALREFLSLEELKSVDSCVVVVMSHGRDEKSFYTSDNLYMSVNDVVERFSNKECPALKGKPKIFIFQYCRGCGPDIGVEATPRNVIYAQAGLDVQADSAVFGEAIVLRDPTYTDMYIVYSTVEGFVSFRHRSRGSWLMEAICHVFMNNAHDTELGSLMKMVSRRVRANYTDEGSKQVCEFVQRAFDLHFYFNPEIYTAYMNMDALSRVLLESTNGTEGAASPRLLSPIDYQHFKPRRSSCGSLPEPPGHETYHQYRRRNLSGASGGSEKGPGDPEPLGFSPGVTFHPRVRRPAAGRRLVPPSDPVSFLQPSHVHMPHESLSRGFSEQEQTYQEMTEDPSKDAEHVFSGRAERPDDVSRTGVERSYDTVDVPHPCPGAVGGTPPPVTSEEGYGPHKSYSCTNVTKEGETREHYPFKRQLSTPSTKETLANINSVRKYLQVNESDPKLVEPLRRIESFVNKKKYEGKRRRVDEKTSRSLEMDSP